MKKNFFLMGMGLLTALSMNADNRLLNVLNSPNGNNWVKVSLNDGKPCYSLGYREGGKEVVILENSPLGLYTNIADFTNHLSYISTDSTTVSDSYEMTRTKKSKVQYTATAANVYFTTADKKKISIRFQLSNDNLALRYEIPMQGETACCVVKQEATSYRFPSSTTTFICPQSSPMIGWKRTKPSYEEEYKADAPMNVKSQYGEGYTFPCLFHVGQSGWALLSETGVSGKYCGSHLSDYHDGLYTVAFPMAGENNGFGTPDAQLALPGATPWRTITFGKTLKPIAETTIPFDVVSPLYETENTYKPGRSSWSWIIWQDASMNYNDQKAFVDLAANMGWEYILMDALWETQVGRNRMPELFRYAQSKGVDVFLWYNSNGGWNDAPQDAKQRMCDPIARKKEMKWLRENGVKGLKVDFFAGDKQETIRLYEAILSDANDYGLQIIFHGCTLPRGWERMYPNYCSSEAVLASENLVFNQHFDDEMAFNTCLHPFIRNAVGSMDFGGTILQKRLSRNGKDGTRRLTTDIFELATAVLFQSSVQNFALTPMDLEKQPAFEIDFMKTIPTTWDDIQFIDGYPGKYIVLARCHAGKWYVAAACAEEGGRTVNVNLPMLAGKEVNYYFDDKKGNPQMTTTKMNKKGQMKLTLVKGGGAVLVEK